MGFAFRKATKEQAKLRMAIDGPAGGGKTMSSLKIAAALVPGGRVAVIDTERGSASKYADEHDFDVLELDSFGPESYVDAIRAASDAGYDVLIIDSLSHAWSGKDGALEQVDRHKDKFGGGWRSVTPKHNELVDSILRAPMHVIATMRTKMEYVLEEVTRNGRTIQQPRKVGMRPIQREGMEYEFDVVGDIDLDNTLTISKTRCPALNGKAFNRPGRDVAEMLRAWLTDGAPASDRKAQPVAASRLHAVESQPAAPVVDTMAIGVQADACETLADLDALARRIGREVPKDDPRREEIRGIFGRRRAELTATREPGAEG